MQNPLWGESVGEKIFLSAYGRQVQANDGYLISEIYGSSPICDSRASWLHLQSLITRESVSHEALSESLMANALQIASNDGLLSGMHPSTLIELKRLGLGMEIREVISEGVKELATAEPSSLTQMSDRIRKNIEDAVSNYERTLAELRKDERSIAWKLPVSSASLMLTIGSKLIPSPELQYFVSILGTIAPIPKIVETVKGILKIGRTRAVRKSAVSMLVQNQRSVAEK